MNRSSGHNNNVDIAYIIIKVAKEIDDLMDMISNGLQDTERLKLLTLDMIKVNMDEISVAIELEL